MFTLEKQHLRPTSEMTNTGNINQKLTSISITRTVRKDNTVLYKSNRYSVPLGTYSSYGKEVSLSVTEGILMICDSETGELIGKHNVYQGKGQLVQDRNQTRDRPRGIDVYIEQVSNHFQEPERAKEYLEKVRKSHPHYIPDQLQVMSLLQENMIRGINYPLNVFLIQTTRIEASHVTGFFVDYIYLSFALVRLSRKQNDFIIIR